MPSTDTTWPEGVIARYRTVGGATVDLRDCGYDPIAQTAMCTGCLDSYSNSTHVVREWAQAHAEKCRALPRPTA